MAGNHVGGDGKRRTAETEECRLGGKRGAEPAHGFIDRVEMRADLDRLQTADAVDIDRIEFRAMALGEPDIPLQRIGNDENVENRIAASKPYRRIGCNVIPLPVPDCSRDRESLAPAPALAVFRQIASGLAHQPERWRGQCCPAQDFHHFPCRLRSQRRPSQKTKEKRIFFFYFLKSPVSFKD